MNLKLFRQVASLMRSTAIIIGLGSSLAVCKNELYEDSPNTIELTIHDIYVLNLNQTI